MRKCQIWQRLVNISDRKSVENLYKIQIKYVDILWKIVYYGIYEVF